MKTIGKYEVCGLLGKGGMGAVYKARLPYVNKLVALKLLSPHPHLKALMGEEEIRRRFFSEAEAMGNLRHPNVVDVLDFDFSQGRPFFTMEYYYHNLGALIGESYRVETPTRMLGPERTIHYARQLLCGLSRLHRAGMVHRDVKPYNLLITDQDTLKIGDFGLYKPRGEQPQRNASTLMVGSPYYAAPEQEEDPEGVDVQADLYSAGVVIRRMLTGRLPDEEDEDTAPSSSHPDIDPLWDEFLMKAIRRERNGRFASAEEMLSRLEAIAAVWERKKDAFCRALPKVDSDRPPLVRRLRDRPVKAGPAEAPAIFECDELWRPLVYDVNDLIKDGRNVLDRSTGLLWQQSGSDDPLDWQEALAYVRHLNERRFADCTDWRLPTVNELFSLLRPVALGAANCFEPVFDPEKKWLWSCDRRTFTSAWHVNGELGFTGWSDLTCRHFVRAVRSPENNCRNTGLEV
ncbi:MAG: protein kinase domain-containing protein [Acidobacteriota bacterium]